MYDTNSKASLATPLNRTVDEAKEIQRRKVRISFISLRVLGALHIFFGATIFSFGVADVILHEEILEYGVQAAWMPFFMIATGAVGVAIKPNRHDHKRRPRLCSPQTHKTVFMAMSLIVCMLCVPLTVIAGYHHFAIYSFYYLEAISYLMIPMVVISATEFFLSILTVAVCCCCSNLKEEYELSDRDIWNRIKRSSHECANKENKGYINEGYGNTPSMIPGHAPYNFNTTMASYGALKMSGTTEGFSKKLQEGHYGNPYGDPNAPYATRPFPWSLPDPVMLSSGAAKMSDTNQSLPNNAYNFQQNARGMHNNPYGVPNGPVATGALPRFESPQTSTTSPYNIARVHNFTNQIVKSDAKY